MSDTTPPVVERARAQRPQLEAMAAAKGVSDLRVLRYPDPPADAPLELLVEVDEGAPGRSGLELFEFAGDAGRLLDAMVLCGTDVANPPAGWWIEPL